MREVCGFFTLLEHAVAEGNSIADHRGCIGVGETTSRKTVALNQVWVSDITYLRTRENPADMAVLSSSINKLSITCSKEVWPRQWLRHSCRYRGKTSVISWRIFPHRSESPVLAALKVRLTAISSRSTSNFWE